MSESSKSKSDKSRVPKGRAALVGLLAIGATVAGVGVLGSEKPSNNTAPIEVTTGKKDIPIPEVTANVQADAALRAEVDRQAESKAAELAAEQAALAQAQVALPTGGQVEVTTTTTLPTQIDSAVSIVRDANGRDFSVDPVTGEPTGPYVTPYVPPAGTEPPQTP